MGLNVATTMTFENNREFLRSTAKNILQKKGASQESSSKIVNSILLENSEIFSKAQLNALKASYQIALNGGLKETAKYLNATKKRKDEKKYILGELWESLNQSEEGDYDSIKDLMEMQIDFESNIFKAA